MLMINPNSTQAGIEELLGQLLACLEHKARPTARYTSAYGGQEIVLDLTMDGLRYTLTRVKNAPKAEPNKLSPREQEIVRLVSGGLPNKTISAVLEISPDTVGTYLKRIFAKLQVCSRAEMVARVLQEGLLEQRGRESDKGGTYLQLRQ